MLPEENIASFAGTGNPFGMGPIHAGETVSDAGSGAGFDAMIASTLKITPLYIVVPGEADCGRSVDLPEWERPLFPKTTEFDNGRLTFEIKNDKWI